MGGRLLIVNCHHHEFKCVPIGSFGLCDHLERQGHEARIFNAALYPRDEYTLRLERVVRDHAPSHIGIVIHWKELLEDALYVAFLLKARFPHIPVLTGGLTAGFLAHDLLDHASEIDYIVKGDPEAAVAALMSGAPPGEVPNLIYRQDGAVRANPVQSTPKKVLDEITYTRADFLIDHQLYIHYLERFLGWTLMIGRGCAYDCDYCGGSKKAFRDAGDRRGLTLRSPEAILRDLRVLSRYTDHVFLGNEPSKRHIYRVLESIAEDPGLARKFRCGYNTFQLMDDRLIDLIPRAFRTSHEERTLIEVAPETTIEEERVIVRDPALAYTNDELLRSVIATQERIPGARTVIYFSRYHQTHTRAKLMDELANIHEMRCRLYAAGLARDVTVTYCFLSTDVGSANWDQLPVQIGGHRAGSTEILLRHIRRYERGCWPDPHLDALCMFRPADIDDEHEIRHTRLAQLMERLIEAGPYYYLVSRVLGFAALWKVLEHVVEETRDLALGDQVTAHVLELTHRTMKRLYPDTHATRPRFFDGLRTVGRGVLLSRNTRNVALPPVNGEQMILFQRPRLNPTRTAVVDYPYLSLAVHDALAHGLDALAPQATLLAFCPGAVHAFDARFYQVLQALDGRATFARVLERFASEGLFEDDEGERFHDFLVENHYHILM